MRKFALACPGAFLLAASLTLADDARKDRDSLQGEWEVTSVVLDGMARDGFKGTRAVFAKNKLSLSGDGDKREFEFALDPTKKPAAIDLKALDGDLRGKTNPAVYRLSGDKLELCFSNEPDNKKRPAEVASKKGSKLLLMTFKRAKK